VQWFLAVLVVGLGLFAFHGLGVEVGMGMRCWWREVKGLSSIFGRQAVSFIDLVFGINFCYWS